jgi:hypothetical protein
MERNSRAEKMGPCRSGQEQLANGQRLQRFLGNPPSDNGGYERVAFYSTNLGHYSLLGRAITMRDHLVYSYLSAGFWLLDAFDRFRSNSLCDAERLAEIMPGGFIGLGRQRGGLHLIEFRFDIETHRIEAGSYAGRGISYFTIYRQRGAALENPYDFALTIDPSTLVVRCEQPEHIGSLGFRIPVLVGQISRNLQRLTLSGQSDPSGVDFVFKLYGLPRDAA